MRLRAKLLTATDCALRCFPYVLHGITAGIVVFVAWVSLEKSYVPVLATSPMWLAIIALCEWFAIMYHRWNRE